MHAWLALRQGLVVIDIVSRLWARQVGLEESELTVVMLLDARGNEAGCDLARRSGRSRQNVQRTLNELERRGVVAPAAMSGARVRAWQLTPLGRDIAERLRKRMALWEELVSGSVDVGALAASVRRMVESLVNRPRAGWANGLQIPREMRIDPEWDSGSLKEAVLALADLPSEAEHHVARSDPLAERRRAREDARREADEREWEDARDGWRALWS